MELFLATFSALFSVVNPFGAMPVFLAAQILGTTDAVVADRLEKYRNTLKEKVMRSAEELRRGDRDID